jgi:hypothetical protein
MKVKSNDVRVNINTKCKTTTKSLLTLIGCLVFMLLTFGDGHAREQWPRIISSKDGTLFPMRSMAPGNRPLCLCMAGVVMPATGAPRCRILQKISCCRS